MSLTFITSILISLIYASPETPLPHAPSRDVLEQISEHNQQQALFESMTSNTQDRDSSSITPFVEYDETGYLFFNDDDYYGYAREIKNTIAQTLPANTKLVVYTTSQNKSNLQQLRQRFSSLIDNERLVILQIPPSGQNSFWTRDNLPVPVFNFDQLSLVDARYYYNFEPDQFLAQAFSSLISSHSYFYEGGNFMANSRGECLVVNRRKSYPGGTSDTAAIPDSIFRDHYGCKKLTRFRHLKGIGHIDEVVKFMGDDVVVTDTPEYVDTLKSLGYEVHLLPEPDQNYETYVNSLIVNDVIYVPTFNEQHDQTAIDLYKKIRPDLKIVPILSKQLATRGQGGIHCITMNYPQQPLKELIEKLGARMISPQL